MLSQVAPLATACASAARNASVLHWTVLSSGNSARLILFCRAMIAPPQFACRLTGLPRCYPTDPGRPRSREARSYWTTRSPPDGGGPGRRSRYDRSSDTTQPGPCSRHAIAGAPHVYTRVHISSCGTRYQYRLGDRRIARHHPCLAWLTTFSQPGSYPARISSSRTACRSLCIPGCYSPQWHGVHGVAKKGAPAYGERRRGPMRAWPDGGGDRDQASPLLGAVRRGVHAGHSDDRHHGRRNDGADLVRAEHIVRQRAGQHRHQAADGGDDRFSCSHCSSPSRSSTTRSRSTRDAMSAANSTRSSSLIGALSCAVTSTRASITSSAARPPCRRSLPADIPEMPYLACSPSRSSTRRDSHSSTVARAIRWISESVSAMSPSSAAFAASMMLGI